VRPDTRAILGPPGRFFRTHPRADRNVERYLDGLRPLDVLNPEVYGEAARHDERIG